MTATTGRLVDGSVHAAIVGATTLDELAVAAQAVVGGQPQHFADRLGQVENQRAKILKSLNQPAESELSDWLAQLLWMVDSVEMTSPRVGGVTDPFSSGAAYPEPVFAKALERARAAGHPVGKATWFRALWNLREKWQRKAGMPRFDQFARECASACADAADWHRAATDAESEHRTMMAVYCWYAAFDCARSVGAAELMGPFLERVAACLDWLVGLDDLWAIRLLAYEVELYLDPKAKCQTLATAERLQKLKELTTTLDASAAAKGFTLDHMRHELVDVADGVARLEGAQLTAQDIARRHAEILRVSAQMHPSKLLRASLWERAAGEYQAAGDSAAAHGAMESSRSAIEAAKAAGEFKVFTASGKATKAQVDRELRPYFEETTSTVDVLARVSSSFFLPWLDNPSSRVLPRGFVSQILPRVAIVGDRVQAPDDPATGEEPADWEIQDTLRMQVTLATGLLLEPLFEQLKVQHGDVAGALLSLFCGSPAVEDGDIELLARAFIGFLDEDFIEVLHLLPPRLEQLVHRTVRRRGGSGTTRPRGGGLQERTFGALIDQARASNIMSVELADFVDATLTKEWGLNIRNNVAHGWVPAAGLTRLLATRLIHVALVLWRWSLDEPGAETSTAPRPDATERA
jgi:hypothetical protein